MVHTIYWTREGKGIHFDMWSPTAGKKQKTARAGTIKKRTLEEEHPAKAQGMAAFLGREFSAPSKDAQERMPRERRDGRTSRP